MNWEKKAIDPSLVKETAKRFDLDLLTASILVRRGVYRPEDVLYYREKDLRFLHNPFLFTEMEDAVDRLITAAEEGEKVKIFGDRDVDGITSTVLMKKMLEELGIDAEWALPTGDAPYGLSREAVEQFSAEGGTLLISVDCGISNTSEVAYAASLGIDSVIIDHHNPPEELPPAVAIIDPKIEESGYPFRDLAGCGVVAKVAWALRFAKTDLYKQTFCLLNLRPGNDSLIIEAAKLENLVEIDRLNETLVLGIGQIDQMQIVDFLADSQILVYDETTQMRLLGQIFGDGVDIHLVDVAPEIWKVFPSLRGKSILKIREQSTFSKYAAVARGELDVLVDLFTSFLLSAQPSLSEGFLPLLDLVALGTLADLMPLRDENRILVRNGMDVLNATGRKGLQELLLAQNLSGKRLSTTDVGWQISPLINATGRMGVPATAAELLLTEDPVRRRELAGTVCGLNRDRKKLGDTVWEKILPVAKRSYEELEGKLVVVAEREMHRGITGIIAARLVNYFNAPAIVVAYLAENRAVGSLRSDARLNVKGFLEQSSDLFIDFGGHDYAAGFSITLENLETFTRRLPELAQNLEPSEPASRVFEIDAELPLKYMNPELTKVVESFEPYGEGCPPLLFLARGVTVTGVDLVGRREQNHVRMLLDAGPHKWPAVYWNAAERVGRDFSSSDRVDIVFRLGRNYFQNRESLQLTILDMKRS